jgi:hypothetical protein
MGIRRGHQVTRDQEPKYTDYYGMLSYKDFLTHTEAGTLAGLTISTRTDQDVTK